MGSEMCIRDSKRPRPGSLDPRMSGSGEIPRWTRSGDLRDGFSRWMLMEPYGRKSVRGQAWPTVRITPYVRIPRPRTPKESGMVDRTTCQTTNQDPTPRMAYPRVVRSMAQMHKWWQLNHHMQGYPLRGSAPYRGWDRAHTDGIISANGGPYSVGVHNGRPLLGL